MLDFSGAKRIASGLPTADQLARQVTAYAEPHFKIFGLICVFLIPLTTIIDRAFSHPDFDTFLIRLAAAPIGLPLIYYRSLPQWLKERFHIYCILGVPIVLPFNFGLMLLLNAAHAPLGEEPSPVWVYQYIVALFFFIQLVRNGYLAVPLWIVSVALLAACYAALADPNWEAVKDSCIYPMPVFATAMLAGILTNRNAHVVQAEQLRAASAIGSNIAHELRTPLASIRSLARGLRRYLPALLHAYKLARDNNLAVEPLRASRLDQLEAALSSIETEVEHSNTLIDMLLVNTAYNAASSPVRENFKASLSIDEAVSRYPFNNSMERGLLQTRIDQDFTIRAPRLLIVHVLFNLIKNALYFVQSAGKGEIVVSASTGDGVGTIVVHDTGTGIGPISKRRLFDRFYTTTSTGESAGIGLSFCKMVMDSIGGSIGCESVEGEYTTFTLSFPLATPDS